MIPTVFCFIAPNSPSLRAALICQQQRSFSSPLLYSHSLCFTARSNGYQHTSLTPLHWLNVGLRDRLRPRSPYSPLIPLAAAATTREILPSLKYRAFSLSCCTDKQHENFLSVLVPVYFSLMSIYRENPKCVSLAVSADTRAF